MRKKGSKLLATSLLVIIFIISLFLRFYHLGIYPVGFHIDEAIQADNAYFLLHSGRDTNNHIWPLDTEVFGDYNPTGYAYLTIGPIAVFGLTEFATRFPGALLGSLTVVGFFFLSFVFFKNTKISLLSSFLLAISPWHIVLSRGSEETLVSLCFIVFGFAFVIMAMEKKKTLWLWVGCLMLFISFFMYFTPRFFVPTFFFLLLAFFYKPRFGKSYNSYSASAIGCFLVLAAISFFLIFLQHGGASRFNQISIFGYPETNLVLQESIREDGVVHVPILITRFFQNKIVYYSRTFLSNYLTYFSGNFLFLSGGLPIWFKIPQTGLVYLIELPFFLIGLVILITSRNKTHKIPILWLLAGPVIAALTVDDTPNIRRAITMFPMIDLIAAYGFINFIHAKERVSKAIKIGTVICSVAVLIYSFLFFLNGYFIHAGIHQNWYRNDGFKQMIQAVNKSYNQYDAIIITKSMGGIYPLVLFYTRFDPKEYLSLGSPKDKDYLGFGKYFFVPQACPSRDHDKRFIKASHIIYVDNGICTTSNGSSKTIYRHDGTKAFIVVYK